MTDSYRAFCGSALRGHNLSCRLRTPRWYFGKNSCLAAADAYYLALHPTRGVYCGGVVTRNVRNTTPLGLESQGLHSIWAYLPSDRPRMARQTERNRDLT